MNFEILNVVFNSAGHTASIALLFLVWKLDRRVLKLETILEQHLK